MGHVPVCGPAFFGKEKPGCVLYKVQLRCRGRASGKIDTFARNETECLLIKYLSAVLAIDTEFVYNRSIGKVTTLTREIHDLRGVYHYGFR